MENMESSNNPLGFILGIIFSLINVSKGKGEVDWTTRHKKK